MARKVVKLLQWGLPVLLLVAVAAVPARAATARDARGNLKKLEEKRPIPQWAMGALPANTRSAVRASLNRLSITIDATWWSTALAQ